ncbi:MAG: hypothetical protein IJY62_01250 [Clostridia bacterium]|nr:hypothetical protein [Clostridia bacterium]
MIYDIADLRVLIKNRCAYTDRFCEKYLSADQSSPWDIVAEVSREAFHEEKAASPGYSDGYIENICLYREICLQMPKFDRFLMHAAVLDFEGEGYAFLGKSGTGKSTHTNLWLENLEGSRIINGDKPVIHWNGTEFIAYGTPWMGKEGRGCKDKTPLKGLCFLEQAKVNELTRLSSGEVVNRIFTQLLLPTDEEGAEKTLFLADQLVTSVPAWLMKCDISTEAAKTSFEGMTGKKFEEKIIKKG